MSLKVSSLHVSGLDKTKPSSIEPLFESVQNSTDFPSLVSASDELRKVFNRNEFILIHIVRVRITMFLKHANGGGI